MLIELVMNCTRSYILFLFPGHLRMFFPMLTLPMRMNTITFHPLKTTLLKSMMTRFPWALTLASVLSQWPHQTNPASGSPWHRHPLTLRHHNPSSTTLPWISARGWVPRPQSGAWKKQCHPPPWHQGARDWPCVPWAAWNSLNSSSSQCLPPPAQPLPLMDQPGLTRHQRREAALTPRMRMAARGRSLQSGWWRRSNSH